VSSRRDAKLEKTREQKRQNLERQMSASKPKSEGPIHLSIKDFDQVTSKGVTLIDFYATWCGPCKMMEPVVERLYQELAGHVKVAKVDVDENMELAMRFQVMGVPTFGIFKDGSLVQRIVGAVGYEALRAAVKPFL
jgi:thioredoxin 1